MNAPSGFWKFIMFVSLCFGSALSSTCSCSTSRLSAAWVFATFLLHESPLPEIPNLAWTSLCHSRQGFKLKHLLPEIGVALSSCPLPPRSEFGTFSMVCESFSQCAKSSHMFNSSVSLQTECISVHGSPGPTLMNSLPTGSKRLTGSSTQFSSVSGWSQTWGLAGFLLDCQLWGKAPSLDFQAMSRFHLSYLTEV